MNPIHGEQSDLFVCALTWFDSIQHGERVVRRQRCNVKVVDTRLLCRQRRQLVEVSGKQTEAAEFGGDVFADGPGQTEAVVRRRASAELVDDDEGSLSGRAGGGRGDEGMCVASV